MLTDAFGRLLDVDAPESVECGGCRARAERLSSAFKGQGITHHNYRCCAEGCPAGGTIVEHDRGVNHRVGPVFGDRDLAVRLATRDHPDAPADTEEVHA